MADVFETLPVDVWTAARDRVRRAYQMYDDVVVSLSGGKDSTATLHAVLAVASELGRGPVEVNFYDEEAIPYETVEYMERLRHRPDIRLNWFCLPLKARNACSTTHPDWYPWHPDDRSKWVRDLPPGAITDHPAFRPGMEICHFAHGVLGRRPQTTALCMGIRMQESMTRLRAITQKSDREMCYISPTEYKNVVKCYPVYDWTVEDVWTAPERFGWDYNRAYDLMAKMGMSISQQRCSPAFGEQPIRGLHRFATCWPDMWEKMIHRVPGAATAARYANTELYIGTGATDDVPWKTKVESGLARLPDKARLEVKRALKSGVSLHGKYTTDPIPDAEPHPDTGLSWRAMYKIVLAGGDKFGRQSQKIQAVVREHRRKVMGIK